MKDIMRGFYLLIIGLIFTLGSQNIHAQDASDTASYPLWIDMMQDESIPVPEVVRAFELYWKDRVVSRGSGWKPFKRWEYYQVMRMRPDGSRFSRAELWNAYQQVKKKTSIRSQAGSWQILGPVQQPANNGTGQPNGMGRINALAYDPTNPLRIWAGAASGGLWVTSDGGQSWTGLSDTLPTLGVSSLAVDPINPSIVYMGTGDRDHGDAPGVGVMKSYDGGFNWIMSNNGMGNRVVGALLIHPNNPAILLAATNAGIFRSVDSAATWTLTSSASNFKDMVFHPTNPNIVYAASGGNFFRSVNNGQSWSPVSNGLPGGNRGVIGVSPHTPDMVYFLLTNQQTFKGMYRSLDAGLSFTMRSDSPNIMGYSPTGSDQSGQSWYNLAIAVDPDNANTVYAGGVNVWKSNDGGVNWQINSHWYGAGGIPAVHADCHYLGYAPNGRLYSGNDGGVHYTDNGGNTWTEISSGLAVSQIYKLGQSAKVRDQVMTGYQDNGSAIYLGTGWLTVAGGDGMECAVNYANPDRTYGTYYYGSLFRLYQNSYEGTIGENGSNGINESGAWVSPFILHKTDPNTLFLGMSSVWRSTNANAPNPQSVIWQNIAPNTGGSNMLALEQSSADPDLLYASKYNSSFFRCDNVNDASPVFINLTSQLPHSGLVKAIATHPTQPGTLWIIQDRKVFRSDNRGTTWTDITGNLPDIPLNTLVYYRRAVDGLYLGTDLGVFYRDYHTGDWMPFSNGLPYTAEITELEIWYDTLNGSTDRIRASTYGRGLWESGLYETYPMSQFHASKTFIPKGCAIKFTDMSGGIPTEWFWRFEGGTPATSTLQHPQHIIYDTAGIFSVSLFVRNSIGEDSLLKTSYITVSDTLLPNVGFTYNQRYLCTSHDHVVFQDQSDHCPETWQWTFTPDSVLFLNGTSASSPLAQVRFLAQGQYDVSLTVTNQNGSATVTKQALIINGGLGLPFYEGFDNADITGRGWSIHNPNNDLSWEHIDLGSQGAAVYMKIYNTNTLGYTDRLITPPLDLRGAGSAYLHFRHAYAQYQSGFSDSLRIYLSDDCGSTWTRIAGLGEDGNGQFATHPPTTSSFVPASAADWCYGSTATPCQNIDISAWAGLNDIRIAFESFSFLSNNIYLDDIAVSVAGDIPDAGNTQAMFTLSPNPATGATWASIQGTGPSILEIKDVTGKTVAFFSMDIHGFTTFPIDLSGLKAGVYIVTYQGNNTRISQKLIRNK